jgi:hypothetical protein
MPQYKAASSVFQKAKMVVGPGWVGVCFRYLGRHHNADTTLLATVKGTHLDALGCRNNFYILLYQ